MGANQSSLILILKPFFTEELPDALDAFKKFQTTIPFIRKLNFLFISIGSDFSKSETVVGQILQSARVDVFRSVFYDFDSTALHKNHDFYNNSNLPRISPH